MTSFSLPPPSDLPPLDPQNEVIEPYDDTFQPFVTRVPPGKDVMETVMSYFPDLEEHVHILSAIGMISYVALRIGNDAPKEYQGTFEICSITGTFIPKMRTTNLSMTIVGNNCEVHGGIVGGPIISASPVQIIAGYVKK